MGQGLGNGLESSPYPRQTTERARRPSLVARIAHNWSAHGGLLTAGCPQFSPIVRLLSRLAILIRLDEQTGGSLRYRTAAPPTGKAAAPADRLRATMRENWGTGSLPGGDSRRNPATSFGRTGIDETCAVKQSLGLTQKCVSAN
jgi:hypothetical protein